jgi:hypothetical protein
MVTSQMIYSNVRELSKEFQEVYQALARAFVLIPQMYNRNPR